MVGVHVEVNVNERSAFKSRCNIRPGAGVVPATDEFRAERLNLVEQDLRLKPCPHSRSFRQPALCFALVGQGCGQLGCKGLVIARGIGGADATLFKQQFVNWACGRYRDRAGSYRAEDSHRPWVSCSTPDDDNVSPGDEGLLVARRDFNNLDATEDVFADLCRRW
jgi:hypothetical protein